MDERIFLFIDGKDVNIHLLQLYNANPQHLYIQLIIHAGELDLF